MSGFSDGVSKLWIVRIRGKAPNVYGLQSEHAAIDHLIRHLMVWSETIEGMTDAEEDARILRVKAKIQATVDHALKHMDERETGVNDLNEADPPDTGDPPSYEEADNNG